MKDERWKLKCLLFEFCDNRTRFRGQVWANGNVQKDLKRSQNGGLPVSFWECLLESFFLCFLMVVMMLSETVLEGRVYKKKFRHIWQKVHFNHKMVTSNKKMTSIVFSKNGVLRLFVYSCHTCRQPSCPNFTLTSEKGLGGWIFQ